MSLCQSDIHSCGACCGILNFRLSHDSIWEIIRERSSEFSGLTRQDWPAFRQRREQAEKNVPRIDPETYICPFLGFISRTKIGCLIHPEITGDSLSQNFSFYGAGICQAYNCPNKEADEERKIENLFKDISCDSLEYSSLAGDHQFMRQEWKDIKKACRLKLGNMLFYTTSFETVLNESRSREIQNLAVNLGKDHLSGSGLDN